MPTALEWQNRLPAAPRLRRSNDGVFFVELAEGTAMMSEEAAQFFVAAYSAIPALTAEIGILRKEIDEGALHAALRRVSELEARATVLERQNADLEARNLVEVERRTAAVRRATVLAKALQRVRSML
jgi:hypothetical protein